MVLTAGSRLGPYEILAPLGAGGMGEVYRARDSKLDRDVALKVLPALLSRDPEALARFEREAKAVAALSHPNILAIHDFGRDHGIAYAVTELLEGETLRGRLQAGILPPKLVMDYALQMAKGLSAAHDKGIVHRDLKPENIFVTNDGRVTILDFGLAKRIEVVAPGVEASALTVSGYTAPGTVMGTAGYMSPEQVRGLPVDHRSDIFAFGAILYELLSGQRAFNKDTPADTAVSILTEEPPELTQAGTSIRSLDVIVRHCLEKDRNSRFQSAKDIAFALSSAAATGDAPVARAPRPTPRTLLVSLGTSVAVMLAIVAGWLLYRSLAAPATPAATSIAVLPFTNLSGDTEQEYFSDGLSEELMGLLTKVKELHVAGRTSSFAFKGKTEDLAAIGLKLHVATVLEGSVRRSGDWLRVSTRLVKVADGYQIWAETYDRKMTEVFAVQDEIARAVVAALKITLLGVEGRGTSVRRAAVPEAYNQYLLGRHLENRATPEDKRRAVEAYQRAIELDPNYAAAYAGLAVVAYWMRESAQTADAVDAWRRRAFAAADRAIALDPDLAQGYDARGLLRARITWDWAGAQDDLERALALDPGAMGIQIRYSYLLATLGRLPDAIAAASKAIELDPLSARGGSNLGRYFNAMGQLPQARQVLARALEVDPQDEYAHFNLGTTALLERKPMAALAEFRQAGEGRRQAGVAMAEHDLGHAMDSQKALEDLLATHAQDSPYRIAEVYAWRGQRDKAFEWLDRAYAQRDGALPDLTNDPLVFKLLEDPRFAAILKKMQLPAVRLRNRR